MHMAKCWRYTGIAHYKYCDVVIILKYCPILTLATILDRISNFLCIEHQCIVALYCLCYLLQDGGFKAGHHQIINFIPVI